MKPFAALALLAAIASASPALAGPDRSLRVQDADIHAFIQEVARLADVTVIVDPRVAGSVSVAADNLSRDALLDLFVSTLKTQGVVATPSIGGAWRVFPAGDGAARRSAALPGVLPQAEAQSL